MHFDEYRQHDGLGLAALVARREVTAAELLEIALARMQAVNPRLNAVIVPMEDIARSRSRSPLHGPFAGVPFLAKNLKQDYAGVLSSCGCRGIKRHGSPATHHAEITRRWLDAGVVIFGQTNTPEFGLMPITEPSAWGPTRNPWSVDYSAGGSSGGAAAAVAAGMAPIAGGNDVGGSIRIPASACGLFGFKPGRARTPWGPERGEMMHGAAVNHVLTRSVRDSAAMLDATHGQELASSFHLRPPERPYLEEVMLQPEPLRIAFSTSSPLGTKVSDEAVSAVTKTARLLESLGHHVEDVEPPIEWRRMFKDLMTMMYVNAAFFVTEAKRAVGCGNEGFEVDTLIMANFGRAIGAEEFATGLARWNDYQRIMNMFFTAHDVYMTPTVAHPGHLIGALATPRHEQIMARTLQSLGASRWIRHSRQLEAKEQAMLAYVPFTELANLVGAPAMSVPLHWTEKNLPLGVHCMGAPSSEGRLFRLAAQLESAQPWFHKVPDL